MSATMAFSDCRSAVVRFPSARKVLADVIVVGGVKHCAGQESGQSLWRQHLLGDKVLPLVELYQENMVVVSESRCEQADKRGRVWIGQYVWHQKPLLKC